MGFNNASFDLTFRNGSNFDLWFQAYCLNPPNDSCDFGPCPNPDVTGIGQQISLYISSAVLAVVLLYAPDDIESTIYPYLVNVHALLISGLISLLQSNLTVNDAIFVLVAVTSPVTLYLWVGVVFTLVFRRVPSWMAVASGISKVHKVLLSVAVIGSLVLWLLMTGIVIENPHDVSFSQKACRKDLNSDFWVLLIWPILYLLQLFFLFTFLNFPLLLGLPANDKPSPIAEPNLLHWTRNSLNLVLPDAMKNRQLTSFILFILQIYLVFPFDYQFRIKISVLGSPLGFPLAHCITIGVAFFFLILDYALAGREHMRKRKHLPVHAFQRERSITLKGLALIGVGSCALLSFDLFILIISPETILLLVIIGPVWWVNAPKIYDSKLKIWISRGLFLSTLIGLMILMARFKFADIELSPFLLSWWAVPWVLATSAKPDIPETWFEKQRRLWHKMSDCGPFLMFGYLVMIPTSGWVHVTVISDTFISNAITFGQLFSILASIIPVYNFISLCWENKYDIRDAIWMMDEEPDDEEEDSPLISGKSELADPEMLELLQVPKPVETRPLKIGAASSLVTP